MTPLKFGIGQAMTRKEDDALLRGAGCYVADHARPGSLHAVLLRSPHAHARFRVTDGSKARAMPGVALILTGAETANLATVSFPSITSPILCLADIKFTGANNTITQVYDTRTFTTTDKTPATVNVQGAVAPALGYLVQYTATKGTYVSAPAAANSNNLAGVIVATNGTSSSNTVNAIIAFNGPAAVKGVTGTNAVGAYIFSSATAGYATTVATKPAEATNTIYNLIGAAMNAWAGATACSANSDACAGSIQTIIDKR